MSLPRDDAGAGFVPLLRPVTGGAQRFTAAAAGASARSAAFQAKTRAVALRVRTTGLVRFRFGDSAVAALATDHTLADTDGWQAFSIDDRGTPDTHVAIWPIADPATVDVTELA